MPTSPTKPILPSNLKKPYLPRAQCLSLQTPVRYRAKGLGIWREGIVENLSQSGSMGRCTYRSPRRLRWSLRCRRRFPARSTARFSAKVGFSVATKDAIAEPSAWLRLSSITHFSVKTDRGLIPAQQFPPLSNTRVHHRFATKGTLPRNVLVRSITCGEG